MDVSLMIMLLAVVSIAVVTDLRTSRIPNWLTFSAMGLALVGHAWLNGLHGVMFSLAGLGTGLGLLFVVYLAGGMGAGDVKLMAAIGSFVGIHGVLACGLLTMVVGGIYAIGALCYQWGVIAAGQRLAYAAYGAVLVGGSAWTRELQLPFKLRYGLAIAAGTLMFLLGFRPFEG